MKYLNIKKIFVFLWLFLLIQSELFGQHGNKIVVIFTGSNNGVVSPCHCPPVPWGGLARRKSLLDSLRNRNECDLVVDYGNFLSSYYQYANDTLVAGIYSILDYNFVNVGQNELLYGKRFFEKIAGGRLPLISSNFYLQGERLTHSRRITIKDRKILFLGLVSQSTEIKEGRIEPFIPIARNILAVNKVFDIVIVLSQLTEDENKALIDALPGTITAVLGNSSRETNRGDYYFYNGTAVAIAGVDGRTLGRMTLMFEDKKCVSVKIDFIPVRISIKPDTLIVRMVKTEGE